jgi:WD40 repeat protein
MSIPARLWLAVPFLLSSLFPAWCGPPARKDAHGDPLPPGAIARFGTIRWRVETGCPLLAFAPDGKTVVSAGAGGVTVWETTTGKPLRRFGRFPGEFRAAAISPDGRLVALAGSVPQPGPNRYHVWEVATGKQVGDFVETDRPSTRGMVAALAFSPDATLLAVRYFRSSAVTLWDLWTGERLRRLGKLWDPDQRRGGISTAPHTLAFCADGKRIIAAGEFAYACSWDLGTGKASFHRKSRPGSRVVFGLDGARPPSAGLMRRRLAQHVVTGLALSPDGKRLAWFANSNLHIGDNVWKGKRLARYEMKGWGRQCLAFTPDGARLAVSFWDGSLDVWDLRRDRKVQHIPGSGSAPRTALAISPDGKTVATADGPAVRLWDLPSGREIGPERGHRGGVWAAALSPDGKNLLTASDDQTFRVWRVPEARQRFRVLLPEPEGTHGQVPFSPDGRVFVLAGQNQLHLFDAASGKMVRRAGVRRLPTEPAAELVGGMARRSLLGVPEFAGGLRALFDGPEWLSSPLGFSPDGKVLRSVHGTGQGVTVLREWEVAGGRPIAWIPLDGCVALAPSHGGKRWLSFFRGKTEDAYQIRDHVPDRELSRFGLPLYMDARTAFFPDGQSLAVAPRFHSTTRRRGTVPLLHLREVHTGKIRRRFMGPNEPIRTLAVSPDGRLIASASEDGRLRLWDVGAGRQLTHFEAHTGKVTCLLFSADSRKLVSCGEDTTGLLWDVAALLGARHAAAVKALSRRDLERFWADLAGSDAVRAFDAVCLLGGDGAHSLPLLRRHLRPVRRLDVHQVQGWIRDLGSGVYASRHKANQALESLGERIEPMLRQAVGASRSLEQRRRVEGLLDKLDRKPLTAEQIRELRAVEVLQRLGGPEALRILETLAAGAPDARLTSEAAAALARFQPVR